MPEVSALKMTNSEYSEYIQKISPPSKTWVNVPRAFVWGGGICCVGQALLELYTRMGLDKEDTAAAVSITMVMLGALLTGVGVYDQMAKRAGAGTLVPITGFANSMVSPALEFKSDVGCIIRIVRENRNRQVSELNPTKFIGKEVLDAAIIPHDFRLPQSQMDVADPSGSSFSKTLYT